MGTSPSSTDLEEIGRLAVADTDPTADVHASAEYRKHVGAHLVVRALDQGVTVFLQANLDEPRAAELAGAVLAEALR